MDDRAKDSAPEASTSPATRRRRGVRIAAWIVAAVVGAAVVGLANGSAVAVWINGEEWWLKLCAAIACLALIAWPERRPPGEPPPRRASWRLKASAGIALAAWCDFGALHGTNFIHYWEHFHYVLGSKYFPELGYDGLYVASAEAQDRTMKYELQTHMRDLKNNVVVPTSELAEHRKQVYKRFSKARWKQFAKEHFAFSPAIRDQLVRLDHGYNPTPTWTFVARLFDAWLPLKRSTLTFLALLDPLLLIGAFILLTTTYGSRLACLSMTLFGMSFASRFDWNGGAFLRQDWLFACVLGICLLARKRPGWAGAAFAYAAMVRVFPVLFLLGPAVVALRAIVRKEDWRWARRFALGFLVAAAACFAAGCMTGRGVAAWPQFAKNIRKHQETPLTNNLTLKNLVWNRATPSSHPITGGVMNHSGHRPRQVVMTLVILLSLVPVAVASWRLAPDQAASFGPAVAFALLPLTCYYWTMLMLIPFRGGRWLPVALMTVNAAYFVVLGAEPDFYAIYSTLCWALAPIILAWPVPDAIKTLRSRFA